MLRGGDEGGGVLELLNPAGAAAVGSPTTAQAVAEVQRAVTRSAFWNYPSLLNSWANYGSGFAAAAYRKTPDGVVRLKGLVKLGTMGAAIFVLPVGFRPSEQHLFAVGSAPGGADGYGRVDVRGDGAVIAVAGGNSFVSLSGITFLAEQ